MVKQSVSVWVQGTAATALQVLNLVTVRHTVAYSTFIVSRL